MKLLAVPPPVFPLPARIVLLVCAAYLLAGVTGHDPWKADDALHLGVMWNMLGDGHWLVPHVAGEAWAEAEPLYYWVGAALAWATRWALPFHDGARLATPLFGGLFLYLLYLTGTRQNDRNIGLVAPLLAIGTVGLMVPIHDAQPASAVLAATAGLYFGIGRLPRAPLSGALMLGAGCGAAFLAGGLGAAAPLLPLLLLPSWRRQWLAQCLALLTAVSIAGSWPLLLFLHAPEHFASWWQSDWAATALHAKAFHRDHLELAAWFTWPTLPLALWAAWIERRALLGERLLAPVVGATAAIIWFASHEARPQSALVLIVPLVLLATGAAHRLRRGAANAFDWFGVMTFTLVVALIWLGGIAMWFGWPEQIARNFAKLEPGFVARFSWSALLLALAFTCAWIWIILKLPRSPWRAPVRWAGGITALWGLLITLWLPWVDYGKTYRPVAQSLAKVLPKNAGCISRRDLGLPQRALIDYHGGIRTVADNRSSDCRWLLVQGAARHEDTHAGWRKIWEGNRPGDKSERLRLYRRD